MPDVCRSWAHIPSVADLEAGPETVGLGLTASKASHSAVAALYPATLVRFESGLELVLVVGDDC